MKQNVLVNITKQLSSSPVHSRWFPCSNTQTVTSTRTQLTGSRLKIYSLNFSKLANEFSSNIFISLLVFIKIVRIFHLLLLLLWYIFNYLLKCHSLMYLHEFYFLRLINMEKVVLIKMAGDCLQMVNLCGQYITLQ